MMQYRNGLIGKHFKSLMQTMIFHIHDLVTPDQFALVRALGELGPILWMPVIDNMEEYLVRSITVFYSRANPGIYFLARQTSKY
jgi:hypothetical protein